MAKIRGGGIHLKTNKFRNFHAVEETFHLRHATAAGRGGKVHH